MELRPIEKELKKRLTSGKEGITNTEGENYFAYYMSARSKLIDEILDEIKAIENSLTDHSQKHIADVLDRIYSLIGKDGKRVDVMELYFLCLIALFHDVGNIEGRKGHYKKEIIYKIYGYIRGNDRKFDDERNLVAEVASKHSGKASDDSSDTIKELSPEKASLWGHGISLRKCAAILRLADECAEGRQRTSNFMILHHKYTDESLIHHEYSNCSTVFIDKGGKRIALTYTIKLDTTITNVWTETESLLVYIYKRILKLNNERLYNKYYSEILSDFKKVEAVLNFEIDGIPTALGLKILVLTDLILPGQDSEKDIFTQDINYNIGTIIDKLKQMQNVGV